MSFISSLMLATHRMRVFVVVFLLSYFLFPLDFVAETVKIHNKQFVQLGSLSLWCVLL